MEAGNTALPSRERGVGVSDMSRAQGKLRDRVAIVTGGGQGMGAAIGRLLADEGAKVAVWDIDAAKARSTAGAIEASGAISTWIEVDVRCESQVGEMAEVVLSELGSLDILVNCAGVLRTTRIEEITSAEWELVLDVNLKGTFLCSQAVLAAMKEREYGRIVNISSSAGRSVSTLGGAHYTAAKAGVLGFTRALAKEVARFGITSNAVCPGLIDTEMARANCSPDSLREYEESFPIPRLGTPEEVARLVLFLVSDATYITGAAIDINGGDLML